MNHIHQLAADEAARNAEAKALREGLQSLIDYVQSDKFSQPGPGGLPGYVNTTDIVLRAREILSAGTDANNAAYLNTVGPPPADGGHRVGRTRDCWHGSSDRAGARIVNGWHCPACGDALPSETPWRDSDPAAAERMRLHWVANHKQNASDVQA